jgi:hypothetical protein
MGGVLWLAADALLSIGLLVCLVLTWVFLPRAWSGGHVMLGTYGSVFLMVDL